MGSLQIFLYVTRYLDEFLDRSWLGVSSQSSFKSSKLMDFQRHSSPSTTSELEKSSE